MSSLRIKGVVKFADRVRRELSDSVAETRRAELRHEVAGVLQQVDQILADHATRIEALPAPTRRAYEFLLNLDFDSVSISMEADPAPPNKLPTSSVRLTGLKSYWEGVLRHLALATSAKERDELYDSIRSTSENIERHVEQEGFRPRDLTLTSRTIRGWLALFAQRPSFEQYVQAIDRARPIVEEVLKRIGRVQPPAMLQFRPIPGLYRLRGYRDGTRVILPTPMIGFSRELFKQLADAAFCGASKQPIIEATADAGYQDIQAELESLSGVEENTAGIHRDLGDSFDRVDRAYFDAALPRPRLTWDRVFTGRKFGHYDPIRDAVMISSTLDRTDTPEYVLDFVMYHELLHRKLGLDWRNGRKNAHTPEFRKQERRFKRYAEAEEALKRLATGASSRLPRLEQPA